jgi:hypothetical protein
MIDIRLFDLYLPIPSGLTAVDQLIGRAKGYLQNRTPKQIRYLVLLVDALVDRPDTDEERAAAQSRYSDANTTETDLARLRRRIGLVDWEAEVQPAPSEEELLAVFALANAALA